MGAVPAKTVRVAIVGVGNCASSLIQGLEYYRDAADDARVPGLMHVRFGDYHVSDVEVVAAFDVDAKKVGLDLSEAISASENNTIKFADVPPTGVIVQRGLCFACSTLFCLLLLSDFHSGSIRRRNYLPQKKRQ